MKYVMDSPYVEAQRRGRGGQTRHMELQGSIMPTSGAVNVDLQGGINEKQSSPVLLNVKLFIVPIEAIGILLPSRTL